MQHSSRARSRGRTVQSAPRRSSGRTVDWPSTLERALSAPKLLQPSQVSDLQRRIGNQGVGGLIQRSLYQCYGAWLGVRSKTNAIDAEISSLLSDFRTAYVKEEYAAIVSSLDGLEAKVQARLLTTTDRKKIPVLQRIAQEITNERAKLVKPMSVDEIDHYIAEHEVYQWSLESENDLSPALIALRTRLIHNELVGRLNPTTNDIDVKARQAASLGTVKGYWVGRGLCDLAVLARGGNLSSGFEPNGVIKWNHYIRPLSGKRWDDPTYRQFFDEGDWAGGPAIFEGDADAFRALGLDRDRTRFYLEFLHRA
jgi:hypothetical protein